MISALPPGPLPQTPAPKLEAGLQRASLRPCGHCALADAGAFLLFCFTLQLLFVCVCVCVCVCAHICVFVCVLWCLILGNGKEQEARQRRRGRVLNHFSALLRDFYKTANSCAQVINFTCRALLADATMLHGAMRSCHAPLVACPPTLCTDFPGQKTLASSS